MAHTQNQRLLAYLRQHRTITPMQAWDRLGIYRLGARVYDLRAEGHPISSDRTTVSNRFGEECRVAVYTLGEAA